MVVTRNLHRDAKRLNQFLTLLIASKTRGIGIDPDSSLVGAVYGYHMTVIIRSKSMVSVLENLFQVANVNYYYLLDTPRCKVLTFVSTDVRCLVEFVLRKRRTGFQFKDYPLMSDSRLFEVFLATKG